MSTYSIYPGTTTESLKLNALQDALVGLIDNTSKLITPKDVRNAVYTTWENISLKTTNITGSSVSYTGYDLATLRQKFYFGKKRLLNFNIMDSGLLNSDTDVFIYNNKIDTNPNQNTKISFLAGTASVNYDNAPNIEARQVAFPPAIDLYISNTASFSKIAIDAPYVNIKGVNYPSGLSGSVGQFLKYNGAGNAAWGTPTITSILNPGNTVSIIGSPVLVNGFPLQFTNLFPAQVTVGGVTAGTTFSNVSIVDMFTAILYPFLLPIVTLTASSVVYESGLTFSPSLYWTIQSRTGEIFSATLSNPISTPNSVVIAPPTLPFMSTTSSVVSATIDSNDTSTNATASWLLSAFDGTYSVSAELVASRVFPFFYGMTNNSGLSGGLLYDTLTKDISTSGNKIYPYTGNNDYMYFAYPDTYGTLSQILDQNSFAVWYNEVGSFTYSIVSVNSTILFPNDWTANFYIYRTILPTTNYGYQFQFIF